MDTLQQIFSQLAVDAILAGLALLAALAINALHKFTQKVKLETQRIESQEQRNLLIAALDDLDTLTTKTVTEIEQTTAKALREAVKQGVKDRGELLTLSKKAFDEIADALKPEYKNAIEKNFGNFSKYLTKAIETKVFELKNGGN